MKILNHKFDQLAKYLAHARRRMTSRLWLSVTLGLCPVIAEAADLVRSIITENFTGFTSAECPLDAAFCLKPDASGSVGPMHFVELVNNHYAVYRKSGGDRVRFSSMDDFWRSAGIAFATDESTVDPRVLYDALARCWYACAINVFKNTGANADQGRDLLLAVSHSADPTEGWTAFRIHLLTNHESPSPGFNRDGVFIRLFEFMANKTGHDGPYTAQTFVVLPKVDLLAQTPSIGRMTILNGDFERVGAVPFPIVDLDGGGMPEIVIASPAQPLAPSYPFGVFKRTTIAGSVFAPFLNVGSGFPDGFFFGASYDISPPAPQPDPKADPIDVGYPAIQNAPVLKNGELWFVLNAVDDGSGRGVIHWLRVSAVNNTILEEGFIDDPELTFFFPSLAVNAKGDVVIGFNASGPKAGQYASSYALIGKTRGGRTVFGEPILLKAGVASFDIHSPVLPGFQLAPWGDWSSTVCDPEDPYTFWTLQEWASATDVWSTQITALTIPH